MRAQDDNVVIDTETVVERDLLDPYQAMGADEGYDNVEGQEATIRDVQINDIRDVNELLKLPNPMRPTDEMQLQAITLQDGTRIERPLLNDLKKLKPTRLRPVTFHWKDANRVQTKAPKSYDDIIQRLLNAGDEDMKELVRANWKMFDKGYFFRLTELQQDTREERLKERLKNLEKISMEVLKVARDQMNKQLPEYTKDFEEMMKSMLEEDGDTLLWPPAPESYKRLAEVIKKLAIRAKYDDSWFESLLEIWERYAQKMEVQGNKEFMGMGLIIIQRMITEWLRHDDLWEETDEGRFLFSLLSISREQWPTQLAIWKAPLDVMKLRDELKIISENKIVQLPMGSKLQLYAAKYLQELVTFVEKKDEILAQARAEQAARR